MDLIEKAKTRKLNKQERGVVFSNVLTAYKYVTTFKNDRDYDIAIFSDPKYAYNVLKNTGDERLERFIAGTPKLAYTYAVNIKCGRFLAGEYAILTSEHRNNYIKFLITKTDEDVDDLMVYITGELKHLYALHISRIPEVEPELHGSIAVNYLQKYRCMMCDTYIKLDQKENAFIFASDRDAYEFALLMKHRNSHIENQFIRSPELIWLYSREKLKERWYEAEQYLHGLYLLRYTRLHDINWPVNSIQSKRINEYEVCL